MSNFWGAYQLTEVFTCTYYNEYDVLTEINTRTHQNKYDVLTLLLNLS